MALYIEQSLLPLCNIKSFYHLFYISSIYHGVILCPSFIPWLYFKLKQKPEANCLAYSKDKLFALMTEVQV